MTGDGRAIPCDRGCCESRLFTPPSRQPVASDKRSVCTRGRVYKILTTYPGRTGGLQEDA